VTLDQFGPTAGRLARAHVDSQLLFTSVIVRSNLV